MDCFDFECYNFGDYVNNLKDDTDSCLLNGYYFSENLSHKNFDFFILLKKENRCFCHFYLAIGIFIDLLIPNHLLVLY